MIARRVIEIYEPPFLRIKWSYWLHQMVVLAAPVKPTSDSYGVAQLGLVHRNRTQKYGYGRGRCQDRHLRGAGRQRARSAAASGPGYSGIPAFRMASSYLARSSGR